METSKLYKTLGYKLGLQNVKRSQRGIIAKNTLKYINSLELDIFKQTFKKITPKTRAIKINDGLSTYYL